MQVLHNGQDFKIKLTLYTSSTKVNIPSESLFASQISTYELNFVSRELLPQNKQQFSIKIQFQSHFLEYFKGIQYRFISIKTYTICVTVLMQHLWKHDGKINLYGAQFYIPGYRAASCHKSTFLGYLLGQAWKEFAIMLNSYFRKYSNSEIWRQTSLWTQLSM